MGTEYVRFIDEPITVEYDRVRLGPMAFAWRGARYEVAEVLNAWQDYRTPEYAAHARGWLHRRHRNYYTVRAADGQVYELYLDRAGGRRNWVLLKGLGAAEAPAARGPARADATRPGPDLRAGGMDEMHLLTLSVGEWPTNCYILSFNGRCIVVDPAAGPERILAAVAGAAVQSIVLTHGHRDHVQGLEAVRRATGAPVGVHPLDAADYGIAADLHLEDGAMLSCGGREVRVVHTPGHTRGSVCLRFDRRALVGDTLFPGGPGHTRTPEDLARIVSSLRGSVFSWRDETAFYPGHGDGGTIAAIRPAFQRFTQHPLPPELCGDVEWDAPRTD